MKQYYIEIRNLEGGLGGEIRSSAYLEIIDRGREIWKSDKIMKVCVRNLEDYIKIFENNLVNLKRDFGKGRLCFRFIEPSNVANPALIGNLSGRLEELEKKVLRKK
ncbi:MAG: hypothetical protein AABX79_00145 [Nanoarchaeota archaeon]